VCGFDQLTTNPKQILDGTMDGQRPLPLAGGPKAANVTLALASGKYLSSCVRSALGHMLLAAVRSRS